MTALQVVGIQLAALFISMLAAYFLGVMTERKRQLILARDAELQQRREGMARLVQEARECQLYSIRNRFDDSSG